MKSEILRLLKESDDYISGQQMCDRFHVSRTAVWKAIEQLKKEGYEIEAVRNRGYRLLESPDIMSEAEIRSLMDTEWAGKNIVYFDEIDSTNNRAKELGEKDGVHGTLFVADRQVAGKGRRGRVWESPKGISIYMTILLRPDLIPTKAPMLTLVMAQSVAEGIREVTGMSMEAIGQEFQRDHSTVVYSIKTMAENITKDQHLKEMCSDIMKNVRT